MYRSYTLILRAPHRLITARSDTQSTFESSRIAIAQSSESSRPCEPFLRRPRAPRERSVRNLSNENVLELKNVPRLTTNLLSTASATRARGPPPSRPVSLCRVPATTITELVGLFGEQ
jgi:hypothetical protein